MMTRTLRDLYALDRLVMYRASALLDELVALNADVEDLRALHAKVDELLHRRIDDVGSSLQGGRRHGRKAC